MDTGLSGRVVLITGAARGIGAATARAFAAEGARVVVGYRVERELAESLAAELGDAMAIGADISVEEDVDAMFAAAVERYGRVDVCVANAAIAEREFRPLAEMSAERICKVVGVNLVGTMLTARAFLRQVAVQKSGNLVLVASTAGIFGEEGMADYAATKAALIGGVLTSLKNEIVRLAPLGRVNCVCPGWTRTEMADFALSRPGVVDRATRTMALRKVAEPADVANQIVVLSSDRLSGHVSGQAVVVAGGMEGRLLHESE
ncbi:MAG: SDR family NAD(P)-dependent oxidoreductase [Gaiellales bacterium]